MLTWAPTQGSWDWLFATLDQREDLAIALEYYCEERGCGPVLN